MEQDTMFPIKTEHKVVCVHCKAMPKFTTITVAENEVYHSLECLCKTSPYRRSYFLVECNWNEKTYHQTPKEAFDDALRQLPQGIVLMRPAHAQ